MIKTQIKLDLPLKEGVLTTNCGVPISIIVNKSDIVGRASEKHFFEDNSDFILMQKPNLTEKDSFFIPAGYDSLTALKNSDTQNMLSVLYDERIAAPKEKGYINEEEIFWKRLIRSLRK